MTNFSTSNVLAIDTSTSVLRLALAYDADRLVKKEDEVERSHGMVLMKKIADICESSGVPRDRIDAIVVCTGPGSFTGLRIGLAAAKGMATALEIPIAAVSLFEIAAAKLATCGTDVQVIVPFKRDELFVGEARDGVCEVSSVSAVALDSLSQFLGERPTAGIGLDPLQLAPDLTAAPGGSVISYDAADLLTLGLQKLNRGETADVATLEPLYVLKSQAEIKFDERHGK